ncbi:unnamed protein product [Pylaiella littoralis]
MGTIPGVMAMPPDPSQKIPPEARGRVRRKKKAASAGGRGSTAAGFPSATTPAGMGLGEAGGGGGEIETNRTFVTSRGFPEVDHPSVIDGQAV